MPAELEWPQGYAYQIKPFFKDLAGRLASRDWRVTRGDQICIGFSPSSFGRR